MQISALKSHIDEQKHRCSTPQKTHSFAEKIEELQEELEKQIENNKRLMSDVNTFFSLTCILSLSNVVKCEPLCFYLKHRIYLIQVIKRCRVKVWCPYI